MPFQNSAYIKATIIVFIIRQKEKIVNSTFNQKTKAIFSKKHKKGKFFSEKLTHLTYFVVLFGG